MKVFMVQETINYEDSRTYDIPDDEAKELIKAGFAVEMVVEEAEPDKPKARSRKKT